MSKPNAVTPADAAPTQKVIMVDDRKISCDGGGGALGHPRVWYTIIDGDSVVCKYCDRKFVLRGGAGGH